MQFTFKREVIGMVVFFLLPLLLGTAVLLLVSLRQPGCMLVIGSHMFMTPGLAMALIAIKFLIGLGIGIAVAASIYRSRFSGWLAIRSALFAGVAFLLVSGIAGWAGSHAAFMHGQRMDIAPWGEDLRLRNFIAQNEGLLCVVASSIAAVFAGLRLGGKHHAGSG